MKLKFLILSFFCQFACFAQHNVELFFDFNQDVPNAASTALFQDWIKAHPTVVVREILGFCDSVDDNSYNMGLSVRRIASVEKILEENNFALSPNLKRIPMGENFRQSKTQSENRKVSVVFEEKPVAAPPKQKTTVQALSQQVSEAKTGDIIRLKNINFYNYSAKILPKSEPSLKDLLCVMEENPKLTIEIQGHICCQVEQGLYDVSEARAKMVYLYLLRSGINRKRVTYKGYGNTRPIFPIPEKTEEEKETNRRVEIRIVEK